MQFLPEQFCLAIGMLRCDIGGNQHFAKYRSHGDPFPLPPTWVERTLDGSGIVFPQRGLWAARSLNCLALQDPNSDFDSLLSGLEPNQTQHLVAGHIKECLQMAGPPPDGLDGPSAISELCSSKDLYQEEPKNLAAYEFSKVKVLHSTLHPKSLESVLPQHAASIVRRASTMIEKSSSQVAHDGPCKIKPYWDPALRRSRKALSKLVVTLANQGLVTFRTKVKEKIGIFFVKKKSPDWIRMVIDARRVNAMHQPPPCTRLATPRSYLDLQIDEGSGGEPAAFGIEADVNDCFYNFFCEGIASWFGIDAPLTVSQWMELGWKRSAIYSDDSGDFFHPKDDLVVYPVFRGLCMGWSWALYFAQEAVSHIVAGQVPRPINELRDRQAAPCLETQRVVTGVYVDNISIIGKTHAETQAAASKIEQSFRKLDIPLTWSKSEPSPVFETVGICLDFDKGIAYNKSKRLWRAFLAGRELLRRKVVSVKLVEIWLGHMTAIFMLAPHGLSCFYRIYKFVSLHRGARAAMWKTVRSEIRLALGVMWLTRTNIHFKPVQQIDAGDSSSDAFALLTTWATRSEIKSACKWREAWRFRPLPETLIRAASQGSRGEVLRVLQSLCPDDTDVACDSNDLKPSAPFGAGLLGKYADWVLECQDPSSWLRTSSVKSQLRTPKQRRVEVDVPALVLPIDPELVRLERFSLLWKKRWRDSGSHINVKEAMVALSSLRRTARVARLHGRLKVTLCDNLAALCAFERGRSSSFPLNRVCQMASAYQFAARLKWRLRHIETDRNPADRDSRFLSTPPKRNLGMAMRAAPAKDVMKAGPQLAKCGGERNCVPEAGVTYPTCSSSSSSQTQRLPSRTGVFLEIFCGTARLSKAMSDCGLATCIGIDNEHGPHHDLRRRSTQLVILNWLKSGRIAYVHLGTPCTVFSRARHFIRNLERAREKERVGLELAMFTAEVILVCNRYGIRWSLENPRSSRLFDVPVLHSILRQDGVFQIHLDFCMFGEKYKKPTAIFTNISQLRSLARQCTHRKHVTVLRGSETIVSKGVSISQPRTKRAGAYPFALVELWAHLVSQHLCHVSRETDLIGKQLEHELWNRFQEGRAARKQVQSPETTDHWFRKFQREIGDPYTFAVFGQHSTEEAKSKQHRWRTFAEKKSFDARHFLESKSSKAFATQSHEGKGPHFAEIQRACSGL